MFQALKIVKGVPFLSQLIDAFQDRTTMFLVHRYEESGSLLDFINRNSKVAVDVAQNMMVEIVLALQYLHSNNIIHGDLKPENVLLDSNLRAHVGDFGLSIPMSEKKYIGNWGTSIYQSPEQLRENEPWDERTDYFNAGIIFVIMLTGQHPFSKAAQSDEDIKINIVALKHNILVIKHRSAMSFIACTLCEQRNRLTHKSATVHPFIAPQIEKIMSSYNSNTAVICNSNDITANELYEDTKHFPKIISGIQFDGSLWGDDETESDDSQSPEEHSKPIVEMSVPTVIHVFQFCLTVLCFLKLFYFLRTDFFAFSRIILKMKERIFLLFGNGLKKMEKKSRKIILGILIRNEFTLLTIKYKMVYVYAHRLRGIAFP